jgi:hypothetical protein
MSVWVREYSEKRSSPCGPISPYWVSQKTDVPGASGFEMKKAPSGSSAFGSPLGATALVPDPAIRGAVWVYRRKTRGADITAIAVIGHCSASVS